MSNVKGRGQRLIPEYLLKYLENQKKNGVNITQLVDSNGQPRFVEGDGVGITKEGITIFYCKWSISGTHLMCVVSGTIDNATELVVTDIIAKFEVPAFILNKVLPLFGHIVEIKGILLYADNYTSQNIGLQFRKEASDLRIQPTSTTTLTANRNFRIQFDLLIDSD